VCVCVCGWCVCVCVCGWCVCVCACVCVCVCVCVSSSHSASFMDRSMLSERRSTTESWRPIVASRVTFARDCAARFPLTPLYLHCSTCVLPSSFLLHIFVARSLFLSGFSLTVSLLSVFYFVFVLRPSLIYLSVKKKNKSIILVKYNMYKRGTQYRNNNYRFMQIKRRYSWMLDCVTSYAFSFT